MTSSIARKMVPSFQRTTAATAETEALSSARAHVVRTLLDLLARGCLYKEIGEALGISVPTVNTYIRRIYEKLPVRSRSQTVAEYAHLPVN
jgi:DNA-binding NarL/FixJ family response regulator